MAQQKENAMTSNESLVKHMWETKAITQPLVRSAFLKVDRGQYVPVASCATSSSAYEDIPLFLSDQSKISHPSIHARAAEALLPYLLPVGGEEGGRKEGEGKDDSGKGTCGASRETTAIGVKGRPRRILDIGSGSGFLVHLFAEIAGVATDDGAGAMVVGLEHVKRLRLLGESNMCKTAGGAELLASGRVLFCLGDGRKGFRLPFFSNASSLHQQQQQESPPSAEGIGGEDRGRDEGRWEVIHVGAAAITLHDDLLRQLRRPGRLFIPLHEEGVWSSDVWIWTVDKDAEGRITKTRHFEAPFVALMDPPKIRSGGEGL